MQSIGSLVAGAVLAGLVAFPAGAQERSDYSVADLLEPCVEGDADSRWGAAAEAECEQYIRGFVDAFLLITDGGSPAGVCLPPVGNRADEVRWAFMKWAHRNYGQRHMPAAEGLLTVLKTEYKCP